MDFTLIAILIGIAGIIYGLVLAKVVLSYKVTDKNMLKNIKCHLQRRHGVSKKENIQL